MGLRDGEKMNNITKIISLVSVIAIVISAVAIGISLNTNQQTSKLNAQLNPSSTITSSPTPYQQTLAISCVYFDKGLNSNRTQFINNEMQIMISVTCDFAKEWDAGNITSLKVNGIEELSGASSGVGENLGGQDLVIMYPQLWVSGDKYTFVMVSTNYGTATYTATAPSATPQPTATPAPMITTCGQITNVTFNSIYEKSIFIWTNNLGDGFITSLTINGESMPLDEYNTNPTEFLYNWCNGTSYFIVLNYGIYWSLPSGGDYIKYIGNCTYTATAP